MNVDPSINMVVFLLRRGDGQPVIVDGPTRADDCVRRGWETVRAQHDAHPDEVTALHSEWQPSADDLAFIERSFPDAEFTYNFNRPDPAGWDAALREASEVMAEAQQKQLAERMRHVAETGETLPILWSHTSPKREMLDLLPHHDLVPGQLSVTLAAVAPTPQGTIGMNHLTHSELQQQSFTDLLSRAYSTLTTGLRIDGHPDESDPDKVSVLTVRREGSFAASAVALPGFYERMAGLLGDGELLIGLPDPDLLIVTSARSPRAGDVEQAVLASPCPTTELVPTVLLAGPSGMRVVAERPA